MGIEEIRSPSRPTLLAGMKEGLLTPLAIGAACFGLLLAAYAALRRTAGPNETLLRKTDFLQFYATGRLIMHGHAGDIYDPRPLARIEMSIQHVHAATLAVLPYLDLPFFALALAPVSRIPYLHAYTAWLAVNCLVLAISLQLLACYARVSGAYLPLLAVSTLLFPPVILALFQGQVSILLLGLTALTLAAASAGRDRAAGAALALAMLKPPFAIPLLLVFVLQRRWQAVGAFVAVLCFEIALPVAVLGRAATAMYPRLLVNVWGWQGRPGPVVYRHVSIATATYSARGSNSLASMVQLLSPAGITRSLVTICTVTLLLGLIWCATRAKSLDAPLGVAVLVSLLISPHVLIHDLSVILVPMAIVWKYRAVWQPYVTVVLGVAYCLIFLGFPLSFELPLQLSLFAILALLAWLARASTMDARLNILVRPV